MKTHYVKRRQMHKSGEWGIQVSCVQSQLLRATTSGQYLPRNTLKISWEWAATGKAIVGAELEQLMLMYPICEFQSDDDLMWRLRGARKGDS